MKNTDITKIRQILQTAKKDVRNLTPAGICYPLYGEVSIEKTIDKALALLPCETCGGSGRMAKYNQVGDLVVGDPCPDCQPKECICCEEITEKNAHLHRNCGK